MTQNMPVKSDKTEASAIEKNITESELDVVYEKTSTDDEVIAYVEGASVRALDNNYEIQSALSGLGFYNGPMDGKLTSDMCKKSILNFQKVYGLSESGTMNTATKNMLESARTMRGKVAVSQSLATLASPLSLDATEKQNLANLWTFLRLGLGCTTNQAAGICGNLYWESNFSSDNAQNNRYPGDHNPEYSFKVDDSVGYGLEQWTEVTVKTDLKSTADSMGLDVSNLNAQLATIRLEVTSTRKSDWNKVFAQTSYNDVSDAFLKYIERPAEKNYETRRGYSKQIYDALKSF